jgi:lysophospholipase L1-like esterase
MRAVLVVAAVSVLAAACSGDDGDASEPTVYVALGDSFSAGVGAPPYDEDSGSCDRSELSWPYVLAEEGDDLELRELRACGGAEIDNLLQPWTNRREPAQIPHDPDEEVGLVTFTIGGNDVGFGDIVARCVLGDCSDVPDSEAFQDTLEALVNRLLAEVYPALRAAYPEARIVHVGYPRLTPGGAGDLPLECIWLSTAERVAAIAIVDELNEAIEAAADLSGDAAVEFADIGGAFVGHELCTDDSWVNPISLDSERAHPKDEGYVAIASAVAAALID